MATLVNRVLGRMASAVPANSALRLTHEPICSFTFDDVPRTAMLAAGRMLEAAGAAGTYYVSGSIMNESAWKDTLSAADLRALIERGHEIGCHTYHHRSVATQSVAELDEDLSMNGRAIADACGLDSMTSFSYPFGEVSFGAKRLCARKYAVSRGTRAGLNYRLMDLSELRAISIYHHTYSSERIRSLIETCKRESAWLVFYTHDVCANPSPWGCTEEEFGAVLSAVVKSGIEIMTVRAAVGRTMFRRAA